MTRTSIVCYAIQLKILEYGDRPEVLERFAKRALEESEEDGLGAEPAGEGQRVNTRGRGGSRGGAGRGRGRGAAHGDGPPRKKVMTQTGDGEGTMEP